MKSKQHHPLINLLTTSKSFGISMFMKCENFNKLTRLLRVTAYVQRFCRSITSRIQGKEGITQTELTASEVAAAEILWLKESQIPLKQHKDFSMWKKQFRLFEVGVLRCKGRLENAEIPYTTRHPALLCKQHHVTLLIIQDAHKRVKHNGVKETLTEIRSRYWIVRGRQFVRKVLHKCIVCRKFEGLPQSAPPPPPLPEFRVREEPAFT